LISDNWEGRNVSLEPLGLVKVLSFFHATVAAESAASAPAAGFSHHIRDPSIGIS